MKFIQMNKLLEKKVISNVIKFEYDLRNGGIFEQII